MATAKHSKKTNRQRTEPISKSGDQQISSNESAREEIERPAHEIYLARGGADGYDQDDWLQAERELKEAQSSNAD